MSLAPLTNVPITKLDSILEVVSKGDGSQERDEVLISSTMTLAGDLDPNSPATLILPLSGQGAQQPLLRYVNDDVRATTAITFDPLDRSRADQRVADALAKLADGETKTEAKKLAAAIKAVAKGWSQAVLTVQPGQRQLRFFFSIAAQKTTEREYQFEVLGPLASFALQTRGSIGVVCLLPAGTTLVDAQALQDPNNPGSALPRTDAVLGGRPCFGWQWTNDPLFRVRYRY